jgi:hypothetical protein
MTPSKPWTEEDFTLLEGTKTAAELVPLMGRTADAIFGKRSRMGIKVSVRKAVGVAGAATIPPVTSYESDRTGASDVSWEKKFKELDRKYHRALHEGTVVDHLVAEISDLAPVSYSPLPAVRDVRPLGEHTSQSALLMLSDTHVGLRVVPEQTLGFGNYNFPIFLARLKYLEESVISILRGHTTMKVDELVIPMLGDMLDGALLHGAEAKQRNTLFSQFYGAGHAFAQFLRALAPHVPRIRVKTVVGNHPRWQNQHRMPTDNRYSNLDMFVYALVEALTKDIPNIEWSLDCQPFSIFEVQGWTFHAAHGDHLRGGDKALGIPNHAIGREISTKVQLFTKHGRQAPNYYLSGHLHRDIRLPHALGDVQINGGFPGLDTYGLMENFNPVDPTQRFFFVHPKYGKTAEYNLSLKFAEVTETAPYVIPGNFPIE